LGQHNGWEILRKKKEKKLKIKVEEKMIKEGGCDYNKSKEEEEGRELC
jgi:hypothetical protein